MLASRSSIPFLVLLSIAKAAKLDDKSLYHVVEDLPGIETQRPGKELVATCSEIMAQNGQITLHYMKLANLEVNFFPPKVWTFLPSGKGQLMDCTPYIWKKSGLNVSWISYLLDQKETTL